MVMSDNISFMNKVLDSFIVFIIGFVYFWLAWTTALEEANKNGRPLIVEDLFVHSGK
jgi:hypothetical protein